MVWRTDSSDGGAEGRTLEGWQQPPGRRLRAIAAVNRRTLLGAATVALAAGCSAGIGGDDGGPSVGGSSLVVTPSDPVAIDVDAFGVVSAPGTIFQVSNGSGQVSIQYQAESSTAWMEITTGGSETLAPGAVGSLAVSFDGELLSFLGEGVHEGVLRFSDPDPNGYDDVVRAVRATVAAPAQQINFDYWVDSVNGDDGNDGSEAEPWRTLGMALATASGGEFVGVMSGTYSLSESDASGRASFLTLKAVPGQSPRVGGISLIYPSSTDTYLRVEGFEVYSTTSYNLVHLENARFVHVVDCEIHADMWARGGTGVDAFQIRDSEDVLVGRNHIHEVHRGLTMTNSARVTVRRNFILPKAGSAVQYAGGNVDGLIEHNHIQGTDWIGYPANPEAVIGPHASVISIRSGDLVIRGNHMHGLGNSSGIMCYEPDAAGGEAAYSDILMENNALYDIDNVYAVRIYNLGANVILRNNLLFSQRRTGSCGGWTNDARYRYSNALMVHNVAQGHDGTGLHLYNNVFVGIVTVPSTTNESANVAWSWGPNPWTLTSPGGGSLIATDTYSGCGNHSNLFEASFFESVPDFTFPTRAPANWRLGVGSIGVDFGDASVQPDWSLGSIGPDGFLLDDGPARSVSAHSVGPYEPL